MPGGVAGVRLTAAPYADQLQFRMSDKDSAREVALRKIGIVLITRADRKVAPMPPAFRDKLDQMAVR